MIRRVVFCVALTGGFMQPVFAEQGQGSIASELLVQLQMLQQEVLQLRGLAEEQAHQLKQIKDTQRDHYLDLDRRISMIQRQAIQVETNQLETTQIKPGQVIPGQPKVAVTPSVVTSTLVSAEKSPKTLLDVPVASDPDKVQLETQAYDRAYGFVKTKKFEEASKAFEQLLVDYPQGKFSPNAHYWLGELFMVDSNLEQAAAAFSNVVTQHPTHWKSSDALYKLGEIHFRLGARNKAKEYLERAIKQFPDSTAARLASRFLRTNFSS